MSCRHSHLRMPDTHFDMSNILSFHFDQISVYFGCSVFIVRFVWTHTSISSAIDIPFNQLAYDIIAFTQILLGILVLFLFAFLWSFEFTKSGLNLLHPQFTNINTFNIHFEKKSRSLFSFSVSPFEAAHRTLHIQGSVLNTREC